MHWMEINFSNWWFQMSTVSVQRVTWIYCWQRFMFSMALQLSDSLYRELQSIQSVMLFILTQGKGYSRKKFFFRYWITSLETSLVIHWSTGCSQFLWLMGRAALWLLSHKTLKPYDTQSHNDNFCFNYLAMTSYILPLTISRAVRLW